MALGLVERKLALAAGERGGGAIVGPVFVDFDVLVESNFPTPRNRPSVVV